MLKNLTLLFAFLIGSMTLTGCFEIIEEIHYKKDGSGTYKFTMDMSQMKGLMDMAMASDTTGSMNMDTMAAVGREMSEKVRGIQGISNIKEVTDAENLIFGVEYDFANMEALNAAAKANASEEMNEAADKPSFKGGKKEFTRLDVKGGLGGLLNGAMGDLGGEEGEMALAFFKDVSYTMIYHFDRKVKKTSNKLAEISDDKKTVTLKYYLFDDDRGGKTGTIENIIKLK